MGPDGGVGWGAPSSLAVKRACLPRPRVEKESAGPGP